MLGTSVYLRIIGGNRLTAAIAEADRLDPDWRWDELQRQRPPIDDQENSALCVKAIAKLLHEKWPTERPPAHELWEEPKSLVQEILDLDPPVLLNEKQEMEMRGNLEQAGPALVEARSLTKYRRGRYPPFAVEDVFSADKLQFQKSRRVGDLLTLDAIRFAHEDKAEDALASCRAALINGRSASNEPSLIWELVAIAGERMAWRVMERVLAQGQPGDGALSACQAALGDESSQPSQLPAMRGERAFQFEVIGWIVKGDTERLASSGDNVLAPTLKSVVGRNVHWLQVGWLQENQGVNLEFMTEAVEAAKLPIEEQIPRFQELDRRAKEELWASEWPMGRYFIARAPIPAVVKVAQGFHRTEAERRCAISALAVERYRLAHKSWPDSLGQMVPGFLPKVPTDAYDRQPLRFRRLEDGVVIYSVGPDGKDNGGVLDRNDPYLRDKDVGFRLWDVANRRQPPKPPPKVEDSD
jgi:hypothetical protein